MPKKYYNNNNIMNNISIDKASEFKEKEVKIQGWIYNFRSSGSVYFLQIRDGSGFMQAIVNKSEVVSGKIVKK